MTLTDTAVRKAKPEAKPRKLADERGLFLHISNSGGKYWRFKYRFAGKEKPLSLGVYPDVMLADAREKRDEARTQLARDIDPGTLKQIQKQARRVAAANTFEAIAREWISKHLATKVASHRDKVVGRLERDVLPYLGSRPVAEITAPEILRVLRRIEARGVLETAHRAMQNIGQVLRYAVATGRVAADPTPALRGALPPCKQTHMASPADDPARVGEILRAVNGFQGGPVVAAALGLLPLLFCRPGELRTMRWSDVDLDAAEWRFITSKTKTEHLVPLARQAVEILRDIQPLTGRTPWVLPGARTTARPLSDAAINAAYRRLGIDTRTELTGHGWRSVARTLIHEQLRYPAEIIEHQLAHAVPDALGRAYNRTKFIDERRKMMQAWADYLDGLAKGAEIVPLKKSAK